jgi:hypothetical protein
MLQMTHETRGPRVHMLECIESMCVRVLEQVFEPQLGKSRHEEQPSLFR